MVVVLAVLVVVLTIVILAVALAAVVVVAALKPNANICYYINKCTYLHFVNVVTNIN